MAAPESPRAKTGLVRRLAASLILGVVVFVILWATVFNAVTSAVVASGGVIVLGAGSSLSEVSQSIFDAIVEIVLGIFGAIADFFSSIFDFG